MMGSIGQTVDNFEKYLEDLVSKDELFDTRKLLNFASDALFSTFFGIDVDTIHQPDHPLVKVLLALSPEITDFRVILWREKPRLVLFITLCALYVQWRSKVIAQNVFFVF